MYFKFQILNFFQLIVQKYKGQQTSKLPSFPREIVIPNLKPFIIDKLRPWYVQTVTI